MYVLFLSIYYDQLKDEYSDMHCIDLLVANTDQQPAFHVSE